MNMTGGQTFDAFPEPRMGHQIPTDSGNPSILRLFLGVALFGTGVASLRRDVTAEARNSVRSHQYA